MAAHNKFNSFAGNLLRAKHDFDTHVFKVALTNSAPVNTNTILANITQIAATGGYVAGGYTLDSVVLSESSGTAKVVIADEVITASGASIGPFRYAVVYNDTSTGDMLMCWYDYGAPVTLLDTENFTLDFDGSAGVFTLA
jgi:flagellar capping protein FliD